jgi:hypothetical protein
MRGQAIFPGTSLLWAGWMLTAGPCAGMTLLIESTDLEPNRVTAVADADGRLMRSGTGFLAVGAFGDLDDGALRAAGQSGGAMQEALNHFQPLGQARRFGLGAGLERIDGAFQFSVSERTLVGDSLVGRSIYVVGGNAGGMFIYKSELKFEADYPVASGTVRLWGDEAHLTSGLLVGSVGESVEVLELGTAESTVRLAPAGDGGLDVSFFEANMAPVESLPPPAPTTPPVASEPVLPVEPPTVAVTVPPGTQTNSPVDPIAVPVIERPSGRLPALDEAVAPILHWWSPVDGEWSVVGHELDLATWEWTMDGSGLASTFWMTSHQSRSMGIGHRGDAEAFGGMVLVPEPGTLVLVGAAGFGLLWRRSRRSSATRR